MSKTLTFEDIVKKFPIIVNAMEQNPLNDKPEYYKRSYNYLSTIVWLHAHGDIRGVVRFDNYNLEFVLDAIANYRKYLGERQNHRGHDLNVLEAYLKSIEWDKNGMAILE